jgi:hypothetical protein
MTKLTNIAKSQLLEGASVTGTFVQGYYYIEERLLVNQSKELFDFCNWIDTNIGGAGRANIDMLFQAFKNPNNKELAQEANNIAKMIKSLRSF